MRLLILILLVYSSIICYSANELEISREFTLFTSQSASGYLKPVFTTLGQSLNTGLYTTANHRNTWSIGLDISINGTIIKDYQKNFWAELPEGFANSEIAKTAELRDDILILDNRIYSKQPTMYGGRSTPIFSSPQNPFSADSFYKSISFVEGNNISFMSGLPYLQLLIGFPTQTQLRTRFFTIPLQGTYMTYLTLAIDQNLDKTLGFSLGETSGIALNAAYHLISHNPGIDIDSWAVGIHADKKIIGELYGFAGVQYEDIFGSISAIRVTNEENADLVNSPYEEIRNSYPLNINVGTYSNFRFTMGLSYKISFMEIYGKTEILSQPQFTAGVTFQLWEHQTDKEDTLQPIKELLEIPQIDIVEKEDDELHHEVAEAKISNISGTIKALGIADGKEYDISKILITEYNSRQLKAILPYIFFDENSNKIPDRYKRHSRESRSFEYDKLLGKSNIEVYYESLNIIGSRLAENKKSSISLVGYRNLDEANEIGLFRAEEIKKYLTEYWSINPDRILTLSGALPDNPSDDNNPDGRAENRRVEINSSDWKIMEPVMIEDIVVRTVPDSIKFLTDFDSDAAISECTQIINLADTRQEFNSSDNPIFLKINGNKQIYQSESDRITYQLLIKNTDSIEFMSEEKYIPIERISVETKKNELKNDTVYSIFNLLLFDFNSAEIKDANRRIVNMINLELLDNPSITVRGFTDAIGDEEYNQKLAKRRAQSSAQELRGTNLEVIGIGESELLFDNSSPEGRFYCRTVIIEAKIPQKIKEDQSTKE